MGIVSLKRMPTVGDRKRWLTAACNETINFMRLNGMKYGSEKWLIFNAMRRELVGLIEERYRRLASRQIESEEEALFHFCICRKHGHKLLKLGELLQSDDLPLFGKEPTIGALVYAYFGQTATVGRCIKIGYTTDSIKSYLASKRIQHDPVLLATTPGDKKLEAEFLAANSRFLADGNEWFSPCRNVIEFVRENYRCLVPNFNELVA